MAQKFQFEPCCYDSMSYVTCSDIQLSYVVAMYSITIADDSPGMCTQPERSLVYHARCEQTGLRYGRIAFI